MMVVTMCLLTEISFEQPHVPALKTQRAPISHMTAGGSIGGVWYDRTEDPESKRQACSRGLLLLFMRYLVIHNGFLPTPSRYIIFA